MKATLITTLLAALCCQAAPEVTVDSRAVSCQFNPGHRTDPGLTVLFDLKPQEGLAIRRSENVSGSLTVKDALGRDLSARNSSISCAGEGLGAGCLRFEADSAPTGECITVTGNVCLPVADVKAAVTSGPLEGMEPGPFTLEGVQFRVEALVVVPELPADMLEAVGIKPGKGDLRVVNISCADAPSIVSIEFVDKNGTAWPVFFSATQGGRHIMSVVYDAGKTEGSLALKLVCSGNPRTVETPIDITFGLGGAVKAPESATKTVTTLPGSVPGMKAVLKSVASKPGDVPFGVEFTLTPKGCFLLGSEGSLVLKDKEGKEIKNFVHVDPGTSTLTLLADCLPGNGRMELDTAAELEVYKGTTTVSGISFDPVDGWEHTLEGVKIALKPVTADDLKFEDPDKAGEALYLELACEPADALAELMLCTADGEVLAYADIEGNAERVRRNLRPRPIVLALPFDTTEVFVRATVRRGCRKLTLPIKGVVTAGGFLQEAGAAPAKAPAYEEYYTFDEMEEPTYLYDDHLKAAKEETPLGQALWDWEGALKVERLLNQGADIHAVSKNGGMTPLHVSAALGNGCSPANTKALLERGADINALDAKGQTPLMYAAWRGHPNTLKLLLDKGADTSIRHKGKYGLAALHLAAMRGFDKVEALLKHGADVNIRSDYDGSQPIHWAASMGGLKNIELLLEGGADINARTASGETPLHWAVTDMNIMIIQAMLQHGADVNARDLRGRTPLHHAATAGTALADTLLKNGADVNAQDNEGNTPLHIAAHYGDKMLTRILLEGGADVTIKRQDGKTPLQVAEANEGLRIVDNQVYRAPKSMTPKRNMHSAVIEMLKQREVKDCAEDKGE